MLDESYRFQFIMDLNEMRNLLFEFAVRQIYLEEDICKASFIKALHMQYNKMNFKFKFSQQVFMYRYMYIIYIWLPATIIHRRKLFNSD